jgi:hypothetical protein
MPALDLGDVTIHYEEAGSGPLAYVFCHGLGQRPAYTTLSPVRRLTPAGHP